VILYLQPQNGFLLCSGPTNAATDYIITSHIPAIICPTSLNSVPFKLLTRWRQQGHSNTRGGKMDHGPIFGPIFFTNGQAKMGYEDIMAQLKWVKVF